MPVGFTDDHAGLVHNRSLSFILPTITALLILGYITTQVGLFYFGHDVQGGLLRLFDLNGEANLPAWYASTVLFVAGLLLYHIATIKIRDKDRYAKQWMFLASLFIFLSIDEAAGLHELVDTLLHNRFHPTGALYYAWILPWSVLALLTAAVCFPLLRTLPQPIRRMIVFAGLLYVGGAVGVEVFEAIVDSENGSRFVVAVLVLIEETMEMAGMVMFVIALSSYTTNMPSEESVARRPISSSISPSSRRSHRSRKPQPAAPRLESVATSRADPA